MKYFKTAAFVFSILVMASCTSPTSTDSVKREHVVGVWQLAEKKIDDSARLKQDSTGRLVTSFQLNSDSTATVVVYDRGDESNISGSWKWKAEKKMGNSTFGLSLKSDVVIEVQGKIILGLLLEKVDGEIRLTVGKDIYVASKS